MEQRRRLNSGDHFSYFFSMRKNEKPKTHKKCLCKVGARNFPLNDFKTRALDWGKDLGPIFVYHHQHPAYSPARPSVYCPSVCCHHLNVKELHPDKANFRPCTDLNFLFAHIFINIYMLIAGISYSQYTVCLLTTFRLVYKCIVL